MTLLLKKQKFPFPLSNFQEDWSIISITGKNSGHSLAWVVALISPVPTRSDMTSGMLIKVLNGTRICFSIPIKILLAFYFCAWDLNMPSPIAGIFYLDRITGKTWLEEPIYSPSTFSLLGGLNYHF